MAARSKKDRDNEGQFLLPNFNSPPVVIRSGPKPGPMQRRRIRRKRPPPALEPQLELPGLPDSPTIPVEFTDPTERGQATAVRTAAAEAPGPLPIKACTEGQNEDLHGGMRSQGANSPAANRPVTVLPAAAKPILQLPVAEGASAVNQPALCLQVGDARERVALELVEGVVNNSRHCAEFKVLAVGYGRAGLPQPTARAVASRMAPLFYPDLAPRLLQGRRG